ncbi:MAG: hypothetical protein IJR89_09110 [Clostridia bacterium]|nr:hypothetical protein [Clostridia bacterium]
MQTVTQKELISALLSTIDSDYISGEWFNDALISSTVRGTKNLPPAFSISARSISDLAGYSDEIKKHVIPLLDQNLIPNMVLAIKDIINGDSSIEDGTVIERVSRQTKKQVMAGKNICVYKFLSGILFYVVTATKNIGSRDSVEQITTDYINSFNIKKADIRLETDADNVLLRKEDVPHCLEYGIDEDALENARLFCFDHEEDLHLLPLCEMASILNPRHKHINPMINAFIRQNKKTQKAILIHEKIRPYEFCNAEEVDKCIDAFKKEITEKKYATIPFLYEGAKYFHRAFTRYAEIKPDSLDPFIFKRHYVNTSLFPNVPGNLRAYIEDYDYGLEHHPEDQMPPPFNMLWYAFDLANCEEEILVFWVNRFIITVCHYLHGFDLNAQYNESWEYKDTIKCDKLVTMEEMYYEAILLLYMSYGPEREEITDPVEEDGKPAQKVMQKGGGKGKNGGEKNGADS